VTAAALCAAPRQGPQRAAGMVSSGAIVSGAWPTGVLGGLVLAMAPLAILLVASAAGRAAEAGPDPVWPRIAPFFRPPPEFAGDLGPYRSPLLFDDGTPARTAADWRKRREEILRAWHAAMGPWPPLVEKPAVEVLDETRAAGLSCRKVRLPIDRRRRADGYLLVPDGAGPFPAVVVVYYDAETGAGLRPETAFRDFGLALARRGFVALSLGWPDPYANDAADGLQPLSYLAYVAANARAALAGLREVDAARIGVVGHSFGGKWAMFAAALDEGFACGAWSDPGVVFDESRPNVNYWDPWYLGAEPGRKRLTRPSPLPDPRPGAYAKLVAAGRDLHELHALLAPRPFLVSGGSEDPPERWRALNHAVAVNRLLGYENRVALTSRRGHDPTAESNEQMYLFFEHFLKPGKAAR